MWGDNAAGDPFVMCRSPRAPKLESVPGRMGSSFRPLGWPKSAGACVRVARLAATMALCFKRAGADIILTYYAKQASKWLCEDGLI